MIPSIDRSLSEKSFFFKTAEMRSENDTESGSNTPQSDHNLLPSWTRPNPARRFRNLRYKPVIFGAVAFFFIFSLLGHRQTSNSQQTSAIRNATLGFERIFHIGLPGRKHKYDAQVLAASITGMNIEWQSGVDWHLVPGSEFIDDTRVEDTIAHGGGLIGAWRSQMDIMEKMVEENIQSALILEDDADWDIAIKDQMEAVAMGVQALAGRDASKSASPYGDDWEFLWAGPCQIDKAIDDRYYVIDNDTTAAPPWHRWLRYSAPEELSRKNTRLIFKPSYAVCVSGYAVTLAGAKKILSRVALHPFDDAHDTQYGRMCGGTDEGHSLKCYAVWPPVFAMHRFEGSASKDSEIWGTGKEIHEEYSFNIVYSSIINTRRHEWGKPTALGQWRADIDVPEVAWDHKYNLKGTVQTVKYKG